MELNRVKQLSNIKIITSQESICYIYKDIIYKVFKESINTRNRIDVISFFIENDNHYCPKLYDFIYSNGKTVGYSMKYYKKAIPISRIEKFKLLKEKCIELIDVYQSIKNDYSLCYFDFNNGNVFVNNNSILLLDIDSCVNSNFESEQISKQLLKEFVLGIIYKTYFFDYETYFNPIEREQIRNILCKNSVGDDIDSIEDLKKFITDVSKAEIGKILKKIPYKIK